MLSRHTPGPKSDRLGVRFAVGHVCFGVLALAAVAAGQVERTVQTMGTSLRIEVDAASSAKALAASEKAIRACEAVERRLSTWPLDSELARLNRAPAGEFVAISTALARDLKLARRWWRATARAFDPGVGCLVDVWGLRAGGRVPTAEEVRSARASGLFAALAIDGRTAARKHAYLRIEEGGFAKGIALDAALAVLHRAGATRALIDLGGQIAFFGQGPETFGIAHPERREEIVCRVRIECGSLATSGNSERGIVVAGKRYGHLLDPRTGRPAVDFGSITVWAQSAADADCLSTGLYVLGPDAALAWAEKRPGIEVLILQPDEGGDEHPKLRVRATRGMRSRLLRWLVGKKE